jgi:hypothetical protein
MNFPPHAASLFLEHNPHKNYYESVEEHLSAFMDWGFENEEERAECIRTDELWTLQWYPNTPVGFYAIAAPTLEKLLQFAASVEANGAQVIASPRSD